MHAKAGDEIVVKGLHVGDDDRRGVIVEVHGDNGAPPYLVRWADGRESTLFPAAGTEIVHIPVPAATEHPKNAAGR